MNLSPAQLVAFLFVAALMVVCGKGQDSKPAADPPSEVVALKTEVETLKRKLALSEARLRVCNQEVAIWANNPDVMAARLNLRTLEDNEAARVKMEKDSKAVPK